VEFRHRSQSDESGKEMTLEILKILNEKNVANVQVDGPGLLLFLHSYPISLFRWNLHVKRHFN